MAFRHHSVDKNVFPHGDKNIFSSSLQFLADLPSNYNFHQPHPPPKNNSKTLPFQTVQSIAVSIHINQPFLDTAEMGLTTDI